MAIEGFLQVFYIKDMNQLYFLSGINSYISFPNLRTKLISVGLIFVALSFLWFCLEKHDKNFVNESIHDDVISARMFLMLFV